MLIANSVAHTDKTLLLSLSRSTIKLFILFMRVLFVIAIDLRLVEWALISI